MQTPPPSPSALGRCSFLAAFGLAAALATLTGCVASGPGYVSTSRSVTVVASNDDYVYYPDSEVYYSNTRHNYIYRDGSRWVTRPQAPRTWNRTSASVRLDFHDAPERHHAEVVRSYPRTWRPAPPQPHPNAPGHRDDGHDNDHRDRDKDRDHDDRR